MYCVKTTTTIEEIVKKSRFLGFTVPCKDVKCALQHIERLQQQHPHANHIVYAYRIKTSSGIINKYHDAGEPSGTAGKPVFQHLEGKELINILVVIVRYFGGIKLGVGGLTRAYGNAAKKVIEASVLIENIEYTEINIELAYRQLQTFEYQLKKSNGKIIQQVFSDKIELLIKIPKENLSLIKDLIESIRLNQL